LILFKIIDLTCEGLERKFELLFITIDFNCFSSSKFIAVCIFFSIRRLQASHALSSRQMSLKAHTEEEEEEEEGEGPTQ